MPPHSTDLIGSEEAGTTPVRTCRYSLQALAVTLAVVSGPLISVLYSRTQPMDAALGSFSLAQVIRGLLCVLMLRCLFFSRGLHLLAHRLARPLLFLAAYAVLTSWAGPYPYQHIVFAIKLAFITLVVASALQLAEEQRVRERWLTTCAWVVLLTMAACIGIGSFTGNAFDVYNSRYATAGLLKHVRAAADFILSTLPIFIRRIAVGRSALAGLAILYASLFFTMRRSALIAAALATCCSFFLSLRSRGGRIARRRTLAAVAALLLLAGIGLSTAPGAELLARFKELNPQEGTGSGRYIFWRISLEHILHRPLAAQLWGEGMGSIRDVLQERFGMAIGCHSDWLDFVSAFGWWGLIGISWWYFELARLAWHLHGRQDGLFQGACALVVMLGLISLGTGGSLDPIWALSYAAMGFWAGHTAYARQRCCIHADS